MKKNIRLAALLVLVVVGAAVAWAQQETDEPTDKPDFVPTETIGVDQGVAFPVDI